MTPRFTWKKIRSRGLGTRHECVLNIFGEVEFVASAGKENPEVGSEFTWFVDISDSTGIASGAENTLEKAKLAAEGVIKRHIHGMHAGLEVLLRQITEGGEEVEAPGRREKVLGPEVEA